MSAKPNTKSAKSIRDRSPLSGLDKLTSLTQGDSPLVERRKNAKRPLVGDVFTIHFDDLVIEEQVRTHFEGIENFSKILTQQKQRQPIEVAEIKPGKYLLISGERRVRSLQYAGKNTAQAILVSNPRTTEERIVLQLTENIQRQSLNPLEIGRAVQKLIQEENLALSEISRKLGVDKGDLSRMVTLASEAAPWIQDLLLQKKISMRTGTLLCKLEQIEPNELPELRKQAETGDLFRKHVESILKKIESRDKAGQAAPLAEGPATADNAGQDASGSKTLPSSNSPSVGHDQQLKSEDDAKQHGVPTNGKAGALVAKGSVPEQKESSQNPANSSSLVDRAVKDRWHKRTHRSVKPDLVIAKVAGSFDDGTEFEGELLLNRLTDEDERFVWVSTKDHGIISVNASDLTLLGMKERNT